MFWADVLGGLGVSMILLAYFLNTKNLVSVEARVYLWLNLIGASLACASSVLLGSIPFTILEGTWALVSLWALWSKARKAA